MEFLYCSTEHPWGHSRTDGTPLKSHGQCHSFLTSHYSVILDSLEVLWGKIIPLPQHTQAGQKGPPAILFQLCGWKPESCDLPKGHPFDLDVTKASELTLPVGHPFILLHIWVDPLTGIVFIGLNSSLEFLCLLGRAAARCGHGKWRRRGTRSINLLS